jgi:hypothetical protein
VLVASERRGILRDHAELHRVRAKVLLESEPGSEPEAEALYAWFTEGFDTRDLLDAKALLEDLVR